MDGVVIADMLTVRRAAQQRYGGVSDCGATNIIVCFSVLLGIEIKNVMT